MKNSVLKLALFVAHDIQISYYFPTYCKQSSQDIDISWYWYVLLSKATGSHASGVDATLVAECLSVSLNMFILYAAVCSK